MLLPNLIDVKQKRDATVYARPLKHAYLHRLLLCFSFLHTAASVLPCFLASTSTTPSNPRIAWLHMQCCHRSGFAVNVHWSCQFMTSS